MPLSLLPNYLRTHRKRLGLSQAEVSFLLGAQSGSKTSRYERFTREPSLATALAYEAIFQKPARELFGGLYQKVELEVAARAKALADKADSQRSTPRNTHKRQALINIAATQQNNSLN